MERKLTTSQVKELGNSFFKKGDYDKAIEMYKLCLDQFSENDDFEEVIDSFKKDIFLLNLGISHLKKKEFVKSLEYNGILGLAWVEMGYLSQAMSEFDTVHDFCKSVLDGGVYKQEPEKLKTISTIMKLAKTKGDECERMINDEKKKMEERFTKGTNVPDDQMKPLSETDYTSFLTPYSPEFEKMITDRNLLEKWKETMEKNLKNARSNKYYKLFYPKERDSVRKLYQIICFHLTIPESPAELRADGKDAKDEDDLFMEERKKIRELKREIGRFLVFDNTFKSQARTTMMSRVYYATHYLGIQHISGYLEHAWDGIDNWQS